MCPQVFKWLNTEFPSDLATALKVETRKEATTPTSKNMSIYSSTIHVFQLIVG